MEYTWLRQTHGAAVVTVTAPGEHAGWEADAAVTATPGCVLLIRTADCAPVALVADGVVGIAHAGWRGLEAGILEATVATMRQLGADDISASIGPCICPLCYEFHDPELNRLVARYGAAVRGETASGKPALDLPAAVVSGLGALDVRLPSEAISCTACGPQAFFSHRARADTGRQGSFVWLDR